MPKHLHLRIPEPCHENWDKMNPSEKGRFCDSCQKQVVDFTIMSDTQLAAFFKRKTTGSVCGRFMNDQLDKNILIPKKRIPWVKYFFKFTLPLFLATKGHTQGKIVAEKPQMETSTQIDAPVVYKGFVSTKISILAKSAAKETEITGAVTNEKGQPVPYASITKAGEVPTGVQADSAGNFAIKLPFGIDKIDLEISSVDYQTKKITLLKEDIIESRFITVELKSNIELTPVIVTAYTNMYTQGFLVGGIIVKRKYSKQEKKETTSLHSIVVYPNPVVSGASVNIQCNKMEEGYYSLRFLALTGQLVSDKEVWIDKEARILNVPVPPAAAGTYFITFINRKTGKRFSEKIIIQ
jgi:hypothetical protein